MRNTIFAILVILGFGALRLPLETSLENKWRAGHFRDSQLDLGVRDQIGQLSFVAALGGFRSLVASLLSLQAHSHWEYQRFGEVEALDRVTVKMLPREPIYWEIFTNHIGYDAASYYLYDANELRPAYRRLHFEEYVDKGLEILKEGIRNNPESWKLHRNLAEYYRRRKPDSEKYQETLRAMLDPKREFEDDDESYRIDRELYARYLGYELERTGQDEEAYALLMDQYLHHKGGRYSSVISALKRLEQRMNIPPEKRITDRRKDPSQLGRDRKRD
jgi:hypothetical protein